jgi:hypothetical protein
METLETNTIEENARDNTRYGQDIPWPASFTEEDISTVRPMVIDMLASDEWTPELFAAQPEIFGQLLTFLAHQTGDNLWRTDTIITSPKFNPELSDKAAPDTDVNTTGELRWPAYFTEEEIAMVEPLINEMLATGEWTPQMLEEQNKFSQLLKYTYDAKNPDSGGAFVVTSPNFAPKSLEATRSSYIAGRIRSTAKHLIASVIGRPGESADQNSSSGSIKKQ